MWRVGLAVGTVLAAGVAVGAQETPAAPAAIAIPEIVGRAEADRARLQSVQRKTAEDAVLRRAGERLRVLRQRIAAQLEQTSQTLDADPSPPLLDQLSAPWEAFAQELESAIARLRERATAIEQELPRLDDLRAIWEATRPQAVAASAPAELITRVDATLAAITETRRRVEQRRDRVLVLEDTATRDKARAEDALRRIAQARRRAAGRALVQDHPPLWERAASAGGWREAVEQLAQFLRRDRMLLADYVIENRAALALEILLFSVLCLLLRRARDTLRGGEREPRLEPVGNVLAVPYSCAAILTLLAHTALASPATRLLAEVPRILLLVPVLRVLARLIHPLLMPVVYALGAVVLADRLRAVVAAAPLVEHAVFLTELTLFAAFLATRLARPRPPRGGTGWQARLYVPIVRVLLAVTLAALAALVLGYAGLARLLQASVLANAFLAPQLQAVVQVLGAVGAYCLIARPARAARAVQRYRWAVHRRFLRLLGIGAGAYWLANALDALGLWDTTLEALRAVLGTRFEQGDLSLALGDVVFLVLALWLAHLAARAVAAVLEEDVLPRAGLPRGAPGALANFAQVTLLVAGYLLALAGVGIDLGKLAVFAGALGVGVGFGLQNVISNFVSGVILLFERPVQVGDLVRLGNTDGQMSRIGVRSSTLRTPDGAEVIVPNTNLIANEVTNWTHTDRMRRIDLKVGVAYGTPPERMLALLRDLAASHPAIVKEPAPLALFRGFGASALDFELHAWTSDIPRRLVTASDLAVALEAALREAGIAIPYPQHEVHIRS
jgi:small-conductance mechanosensitive channel